MLTFPRKNACTTIKKWVYLIFARLLLVRGDEYFCPSGNSTQHPSMSHPPPQSASQRRPKYAPQNGLKNASKNHTKTGSPFWSKRALFLRSNAPGGWPSASPFQIYTFPRNMCLGNYPVDPRVIPFVGFLLGFFVHRFLTSGVMHRWPPILGAVVGCIFYVKCANFLCRFDGPKHILRKRKKCAVTTYSDSVLCVELDFGIEKNCRETQVDQKIYFWRDSGEKRKTYGKNTKKHFLNTI